jgi:ankyrin repeat protein
MTLSDSSNFSGKTPEELGLELLHELRKSTFIINKERALALIKAGADLDITGDAKFNMDQNTALLTAAHKGHTECVELLLQRGAKVNETNRNDNSALMLAVMDRHDDCVYLLLAAGADPNVQNHNGYTALMQCTGLSFKKVEYIPLLLEAGADLDLKNHTGDTALDMARKNSWQKDALHILEAAVPVQAAQKAEKAKQAHEQFLQETDFSKGLSAPLRAAKPLVSKSPSP